MDSGVAPRAGAWIETVSGRGGCRGHVSLPVRERGLKLRRHGNDSRPARSLPVRERGLKPRGRCFCRSRGRSLPVRERGLKLAYCELTGIDDPSLPVRERGLKQGKKHVRVRPRFVAPRAGAWIETVTLRQTSNPARVAPRAGAWIETLEIWRKAGRRESLPVRERGLKRQYAESLLTEAAVAPRAGAWIETKARGTPMCKWGVAPRAGAWIETGRSPETRESA